LIEDSGDWIAADLAQAAIQVRVLGTHRVLAATHRRLVLADRGREGGEAALPRFLSLTGSSFWLPSIIQTGVISCNTS
jgi:hypothetical protein